MSNNVETEIVKVDRKTIRFYGMGGTGINITSEYMKSSGKRNVSIRAQESFSLFDTSVANLHGVDSSIAYVCEDSQGRKTDGGGSDRGGIAQIVADNIKPFVLKHPPKDLNVVVFNVSGATGSTGGPLLIDQLLSEGAAVVAIVTVSLESQTAAENAFRTIQGLEAASQRHGLPIVFSYTTTDSRRTPRDQYNLYQLMTMESLSILGSGRNSRIDGSDVANLFNFHKNTPVPASIALLEVSQLKGGKYEEIEKDRYISAISILRSETEKHPMIEAACSKVGYLLNDPNENDSLSGYFYGVSLDSLNKKVISNLETIRKEAGTLGAIVPKVKSLLSESDKSGSGVGNLFL